MASLSKNSVALAIDSASVRGVPFDGEKIARVCRVELGNNAAVTFLRAAELPDDNVAGLADLRLIRFIFRPKQNARFRKGQRSLGPELFLDFFHAERDESRAPRLPARFPIDRLLKTLDHRSPVRSNLPDTKKYLGRIAQG